MPTDNYFADAEEAPKETMPSNAAADGESETAVLPKSILAGKEFKPGDELVLTIVRLHDDSVEVKYASTESETKDETAEAPMPPSAQDQMGGMME